MLAIVELEPGAIAEEHSHVDAFAPPHSEWAAAEAGEPGPGRWP